MSASGRLVEDEAWVTLATDDTYALGALVLAHSLRRVGTCRKLVVLITPGITSSMRESLSQAFDLVQLVNVMDSGDSANLALLTRPELGITFTKLHCWRLTQYKKCVFLDADTLVVGNCDELFERDEFSAAPDVGWPDCFNSGVFVFRPSNETYGALLQCALTTGSFDGGDQGLLNIFFSDWATKDIAKHLPFIYNMTSSVAYSYLPAYVYFGKDVKIVHFIGPIKPWNHRFNTMTGKVEPTPGAFHALEHLQFWWDIFMQDVQGQLQPGLAGLAGQLALITLGQEMTPEQKALEDRARQFSWEQGQIDYLGTDAFANIQRKLDESLNAQASASQTTSTSTEKSGAAPRVAPSAEETILVQESVGSASGEVTVAKTDIAVGEPVSSTPLHSSEVSLGEPAVSEPVKSTESELKTEVVKTRPEAAVAVVTDAPPSVPTPVPDRPVTQPIEQKQPLTQLADPSPVSKAPSIASEVPVTRTKVPSKPTPPPSSPVAAKPSTPPVSVAQSVKSPPLKQVPAAPAPVSPPPPPASAAPAPVSPPPPATTAAAATPVGPSKRSSPKVASSTSATPPKTVSGSEPSTTSPLAAASTKTTESRSAAAAPTKQPKGTKKPKSP